ncbi:DUF4153 domain-containing protein [Gemmobacter lanyuensis]|uniref:DUF4153 domain-containing protein n=1 Tax=Gemmobacter lanyuensis TaxID=1054497 RepID=A0A918IXC2_9RHOB|nr:DUF4153 domain-containing protein [Gemmobacter lanyuensis]GGW37270.1 DUF4153 domain-containing protein [Gemmobacter lanyuensis]
MMERATRQRMTMATVGGLAGLSFYALSEVLERHWLPERPALVLIAFAVVFTFAVLGMAGPVRLGRASLVAAPLAVAVALLLGWASQRYDSVSSMFDQPIPVLSALVLIFVPLPFLVAALLGRWRDYPLLFAEAWTIVIRYASAWLFVGLVYLLLFLSDLLLSMVGVTAIATLMDLGAVSSALTGAMLGLGIAVVDELSDAVSPYLVLRLLRLLLPPVLLVLLVFLVALAIGGVDRLFGALSAAVTLLGITAIGATLVTSALDKSDATATRSILILTSARIMAGLLILPAALGTWAVWLRAVQYGWTPDRIFAACVAGLGLGYGGLYLLAVLRGQGWAGRIRQANVTMALVLLALAVALLTPILNAEALATQSQIARLDSGRITADQLDVQGLAEWGRPGAAALAELERRAQEPGQEALAARLAARGRPAETEARAASDLRQDLAVALPLRPVEATDLRDAVLASLTALELEDWLRLCRAGATGGVQPCVMMTADFIPQFPGPEVLVLLRESDGWLRMEAFGMADGQIQRRQVVNLGATLPQGDTALSLLHQLQSQAVPQLAPVPLNALQMPDLNLMMVP